MNILQIDRKLAFINKRIFCAPSTQPTNVEMEKKKVLKDKSYNPQLKYKRYPHNLDSLKRELQSIKPDNSVLGNLFKGRRDELINMVNLIKSVGTSRFSAASIKFYDKPSRELIIKAKKLLELEPENNESLVKHNTLSTIKKFLDSFLSHGFNWQIREREMIIRATFNVSQKILYINKGRTFDNNELKRLIVHEIGTHITRAENAKKQKYRLFLVGFPNYFVTEEGLAVYNEEKAGLLTNDVLKEYAGRVVAVDLALKNPFNIVYNTLLEFFPKEQAWTLALRAKRGTGNTARPGAYTKDYIYLKGWYDIKNFVKKGGNVKDLYVGKIGISHLPLLKKI